MSKLDCGCRYEGERWLSLCDKHESEWREVHERWAREHKPLNEHKPRNEPQPTLEELLS